MATTKKNVKNNFSQVFAQIDTVEILCTVTANILSQVDEAFVIRGKELSPRTSAEKLHAKLDKALEAIVKNVQSEAEIESDTKSSKSAKNAKSTKSAKAAKKEEPTIEITDKAAIKKLGLTFEKYSEKSWALFGDTKPIRKELAKLGGRFNANLGGKAGWVFCNKNAAAAAKALGMKLKKTA